VLNHWPLHVENPSRNDLQMWPALLEALPCLKVTERSNMLSCAEFGCDIATLRGTHKSMMKERLSIDQFTGTPRYRTFTYSYWRLISRAFHIDLSLECC
jgi:hypothetical protein